jgi:hypothetical protein
MEADRKAMANQANVPADPQFQSRTTYRVKNKVIYCLDGARIGIQYETYFAGNSFFILSFYFYFFNCTMLYADLVFYKAGEHIYFASNCFNLFVLAFWKL